MRALTHVLPHAFTLTCLLAAAHGSAFAADSAIRMFNAPPATAPAAAPIAAPLATLAPAGEGRRVYLKLNCYGCHGMRGAGGMGPRVVGTELGDVTEKVMQGADSGMPSYAKYVTQTDLVNIAAYLRSIGTKAEPKFNDWWVAVPLK